ncbi:hypothetical protein LVJ94_01720 [Pendulispora rubella]|uniref:Uncharacterized protein n=1 Tax=Pendulispora rubella TaxID=2741070 RepID=A0ABZ2LB72_9BACT
MNHRSLRILPFAFFAASACTVAPSEAPPERAVSVEQHETIASLHLRHAHALSDFEGNTFLEAMSMRGGIKESLDTDEATHFAFASPATLHAVESNFDPQVRAKLSRFMKDGAEGLDELVEALAGQQTTPAGAPGAIGTQLENLDLLANHDAIGLAAVSLSPFLSLASGAGTVVRVHANNYYYNIGYKPGSSEPAELAKHVKSGRSFGAGPMHRALDASDVFYLTEMDHYFGEETSPEDFFRALLQILLRCDASGYARLSDEGQTVATDFLAIYTAELDRHLMSGLAQHPWENDLAEVTMLSSYGTPSGLVRVDGQLRRGTPKDYFGVGHTGSGIGITRRDRMALQRAVTDAERTLHPEVVRNLESIVGHRGGDAMHAVMLYLNDADTQRDVRRNGGRLLEAVTTFLTRIHDDASAITDRILSE